MYMTANRGNKEELSSTLINIGFKVESGLNRNIRGLRRISVLEWLEEHGHKSKNIIDFT